MTPTFEALWVIRKVCPGCVMLRVVWNRRLGFGWIWISDIGTAIEFSDLNTVAKGLSPQIQKWDRHRRCIAIQWFRDLTSNQFALQISQIWSEPASCFNWFLSVTNVIHQSSQRTWVFVFLKIRKKYVNLHVAKTGETILLKRCTLTNVLLSSTFNVLCCKKLLWDRGMNERILCAVIFQMHQSYHSIVTWNHPFRPLPTSFVPPHKGRRARPIPHAQITAHLCRKRNPVGVRLFGSYPSWMLRMASSHVLFRGCIFFRAVVSDILGRGAYLHLRAVVPAVIRGGGFKGVRCTSKTSFSYLLKKWFPATQKILGQWQIIFFQYMWPANYLEPHAPGVYDEVFFLQSAQNYLGGLRSGYICMQNRSGHTWLSFWIAFTRFRKRKDHVNCLLVNQENILRRENIYVYFLLIFFNQKCF